MSSGYNHLDETENEKEESGNSSQMDQLDEMDYDILEVVRPDIFKQDI